MANGEHRLTVLGAGVMGTNIATLAVGYGVPVVLVDVDDATLAAARTKIDRQLRHAQLMRALPAGVAPGELVTTTEPADGAGATLVIEAIVEHVTAKTEVLSGIAKLVAPGTPLVTNTSGIPVDELAAALDRPADLVGTHFMNPTYLITAVEIIRGPRTGEAAMAGVRSLLAALGREGIVVRDSPGFVTSRLLHPMINDAARVVEEGVADVESVDALMRTCLGHPTGPLATADLIGLDNLVDSLNALYERTGDPGCRPCDLLLAKVRDGDLGRKTGRGFYDHGRTPL